MRSRHCRRRLLWCLHVMSLSRAGSYYSITHLWGPCALDALAGTGAVDLPSTSVVNLKSKGPRGIHTSHSRHTTCTQSTLADEPRLGQRQAHGETSRNQWSERRERLITGRGQYWRTRVLVRNWRGCKLARISVSTNLTHATHSSVNETNLSAFSHRFLQNFGGRPREAAQAAGQLTELNLARRLPSG